MESLHELMTSFISSNGFDDKVEALFFSSSILSTSSSAFFRLVLLRSSCSL